MSWLSSWRKRIKITVDSGDVDSALTWFPVLLYISESSGINSQDISFVFDEVGASSKKIAVTDDTGTNQLYVEIEKWDYSNKKAWLWVSKTGWSISNTVDTIVYLYYDKNHVDNTNYVDDINTTAGEKVWDDDFVLVMHLVETSGTYYDSTSNNNDSDVESVTSRTATAKIGGTCPNFDGADDYIRIPDDSTMDLNGSSMTIESWINSDIIADTGSEQAVIGKNGNSGGALPDGEGWNHELYPHKNIHIQNGEGSGGMSWTDTDVLALNNTWYHVVASWNTVTNAPTFYANGASQTMTQDTMADWNAVPNDAFIGMSYGAGYPGSPRYPYEGEIDEIRISKIQRPAAYVKACYETGRDHLLDFGSEEKIPPRPTVAVGNPLMF